MSISLSSYFSFFASGATFTFNQTNWNGGVTANTATHSTNQSGWAEYESKDANIASVNAGADIELTSMAAAATHTTDTDFSAGTTSNTSVIGSLTNGSIGLTGTVKNPSWETLSGGTIADVASGAALLYTGSGDYVYALSGNSSVGFYRYSLSKRVWATLASIPAGVGFGGALAYAGGDFIYGLPANGSAAFFRYSISSNSWTAMTSAPLGITFGGPALVYPGSGDYLYTIRGNSTTTFYRYSISGNSWTSMTALPGATGVGTALVYPGSGDFMYALRGNGTTDFYRYSISGNSWTSMTVLPGATGNGAALVSTGSGDYIYALRGGGTNFYRYSISGNSWSSMATTPGVIGSGGALVSLGPASDYLYAFHANGSRTLSRYSISGNSWTMMSPGYASVSTLVGGSTLGDFMYYLRGEASTDFYRYSISNNEWIALAALPGNSTQGDLVYPGSGDYLYALAGASTAFYRYSISGNSWTTMTVTPGAIAGGALISPGSGDFLYAIRGGTTDFYRYSISGNSWTSMTALPAIPSTGTSLAYPGSGDFLYALRANATTDFYRYSISGNSWTSMAAFPGGAALGSALLSLGSGDYIYGVRGGAGDFYRYSISGNSWTTLSPLNGVGGGTLAYPGSGDYIYALNSGLGFFRYSISSDTGWTAKTVAPATITSGSSLVYPGSGDYMYAFRGNATTTFYRYSISGNSWTSMTSVPGATSGGASLVSLGSGDYLYATRGGTTDFYRYSISGNSWTSMTVLPGAAGVGASLAYPGSGDYIYATRGGNLTDFYRYSISGNSWTSMTVAPGTLGAGSDAVYPGSGDYVYVLRGVASRTMYRYSISGNSWITLSGISAGANVSSGGSLVYPGSGDYIYSLSGNSTSESYRYSILGDYWDTSVSIPCTISEGANLVFAQSKLYTLCSNTTTTFYSLSPYTYPSSGTFDSATMDFGTTITLNPVLSTLDFSKNIPSGAESSCTVNTGVGCALKFQVATNNDNITWSYVGPDGTSGTYFTSTGETAAAVSNVRYARYRAYLATVDTSVSPIFESTTVNYNRYPSSQTLISSPYNAESFANLVAKLFWTTANTSGTEVVQLQVRSASTLIGLSSATWCGYEDCSGTSYFDAGENNSNLNPAHPLQTGNDDQYLQYRLILSSAGGITPTLRDMTIQYVVNANPEFDASFDTNGVRISQISDSGDPNWGKVKIEYRLRDLDTTTGTNTPNVITPSFFYNTGSGWNAINATFLSANATTNKTVEEANYTTYTAYWDVQSDTDFGDMYDATVQVRMTANDNEAANNTTSADDTIGIDTKAPVLGGVPIIVDASTTPATITLSATDDSSLSMKTGLLADVSDGTYVSYASPTTKALSTNPDTVYVKFRDIYGNETGVSSAASAESPTMVMIQDISNVPSSEWRLFIAWQSVSAGSNFSNYKLYRSTDGISYSLLTTINTRTLNYYLDDTPLFDTVYYYKISMTNTLGNVSWFSSSLQGKANGTQDAGEGGGGSETTPPIISSVQSGSISTTQATITWDTDELSDSTVGFDTVAASFIDETGVSAFSDSDAGTGKHAVTLSGLSPNTTYYYQVKSSDPSGNEAIDNNGGAGYSFTTTPGPAISGVALESAANTQATIVWNTDVASSTFITYSTSVSGGALVTPTEVGSGALVTAHSHTLTGLTTGTTYYFSVKSVDGSANIATNNNGGLFYQFTTPTDSTGPTLSSVTASVTTHDKAVLTWATDEQANSQVRYALVSGGPYTVTSVSATYSEDHYVILSTLSSDTTYYYRVVSSDLSGNQTVSSESTFTTQKDPSFQHDPLGTISDISATLVTDSNAILSATTDQPAICTVEYGTAPGSYTATPVSETLYNERHSLRLSSLLFSTTYYYRFTCEDNLGTTVQSNEESFATLAGSGVSSVAPSISGIDVADITGSTATVTWSTSEDSSGFVYYGIETFDESIAGEGLVNSDVANYATDHTVKLEGLLPKTKYTFKVSSADTDGNITFSGEETFTTSDAPFFENIQEVIGNDFSSVVLSWTTPIATDSIVEFGTVAGKYSRTEKDTKKTKEHSVTLSGLSEGSSYVYRIKGTDGESITRISAGNSFSLPSRPVIRSLETQERTTTGVTIVIETDVPSTVLISLEKDGESVGSQGSAIFETTQSIALRNLDPNSRYTAEAFVRGENGAERVEEFSFETERDISPPEVSSLKSEAALSANDEPQIAVTFKTSEPSKTKILYRKGRTGEEKELRVSDALTENHAAVTKEFEPGVTYFFRIDAVDNAGNTGSSNEFALATPRKKENIIQIISKNFGDIFGWIQL